MKSENRRRLCGSPARARTSPGVVPCGEGSANIPMRISLSSEIIISPHLRQGAVPLLSRYACLAVSEARGAARNWACCAAFEAHGTYPAPDLGWSPPPGPIGQISGAPGNFDPKLEPRHIFHASSASTSAEDSNFECSRSCSLLHELTVTCSNCVSPLPSHPPLPSSASSSFLDHTLLRLVRQPPAVLQSLRRRRRRQGCSDCGRGARADLKGRSRGPTPLVPPAVRAEVFYSGRCRQR